MRVIRNMTVMILLLIRAAGSFASVEFTSSEIDTGDNRQGYWAADMNGDLLKDILIATWSESGGREVLIYTQEENGKFSNTPWRRIEIKKDIIAFALADLRPAPGNELLLFTASACYSLSSAIQGYAGNLKKLFEWELIKSVPDKKKIDFIGVLEDLNGEGYVDLLLPGRKQYALFRGRGGESFSKASNLPVAEVDIHKSRKNNITVTTDLISVRVGDIYSNLLVHKLRTGSANKIALPPILSHSHWIPGISTGRFDTDTLDDFIYLDDTKTEKKNTKRVNLIYQPTAGKFPAVPHWRGTLDTDGNVKMMDFNGDGLTDLFTVKMKLQNATMSIFLNREGKFDFSKPDHVMKLKGELSNFQAVDINRDGSPELVMNAYYAPPPLSIGNAGITRKLLIFTGGESEKEAPLFDRKPAFVYEEKFDANHFKNLWGKISFSDDIDGDGINDVVSIDKNGALIVNRINPDFKRDTEPFLRFAPRHFISNDTLVKLNRDDRTDIILEHQHGLSLIISQQGARP